MRYRAMILLGTVFAIFFIGLMFFFMGVGIAYSHDSEMSEFFDTTGLRNIRLEVHEDEEIDLDGEMVPFHTHQWCYDYESGGKIVQGSAQHSWYEDELPPPPPPPPPPVVNPPPDEEMETPAVDMHLADTPGYHYHSDHEDEGTHTHRGHAHGVYEWHEHTPLRHSHPRMTEPPVVVPPPIVKPPVVDPPVVDPPEEEEPNEQPISVSPDHDRPMGVSPGVSDRVTDNRIESDNPVPVAIAPPPPPVHDIIVTEIMFHDNGQQDTSQWFELYNRGGDANLDGWLLSFSTQEKSTSGRVGESVVVFGDHVVDRGGVLVVALKQEQSWSRNIENYIVVRAHNLKNKWVLSDADGDIIHERSVRWQAGWNLKTGGNRVSVAVVPTEPATSNTYYGRRTDVGTPGWHEDVAPQAPSLLRNKAVLWGELKK